MKNQVEKKEICITIAQISFLINQRIFKFRSHLINIKKTKIVQILIKVCYQNL